MAKHPAKRKPQAPADAQPGKRRAKGKAQAADFYEAQDDDPEEVKNANKFDVSWPTAAMHGQPARGHPSAVAQCDVAERRCSCIAQ